MVGNRIMDSIENFSLQLFVWISQSEDTYVLNAFTTAKEKYTGKSKIQSSLGKFATAEKRIISAKGDIFIRLQAVGNFFANGSWNPKSANTSFLLALIDATGYQRAAYEKDEYLFEKVIPTLRRQICQRIENKIIEETEKLRKGSQSRQKLTEKRRIQPQNLLDVILCETPEGALQAKRENPHAKIFSITSQIENDGALQWQLNWHDIEGIVNFLPINSDLQRLLGILKDGKLPHPNTDAYDQIKVCCNNMMQHHTNTYLFDDPARAAEFSREHPGKHCFCLTSSQVTKDNEARTKWQLAWYDLQGKANYLSVDKPLEKLLQNTTHLPESTSAMHYEIKLACVRLVEEVLDKINVLINAGQSSSTALMSTYVLCPDPLQLTWYDSLGLSQSVQLDNFPALNNWLRMQTPDSLKSKEVITELKVQLVRLNIRREVDEAKQNLTLQVLQQRHHISLVVTNNLAEVKRFLLRTGIYFLTREAGEINNGWVLYLRQKGTGEQRAFNEKVDTSRWGDWSLFCKLFLVGMPENLNKDIKEKAREIIWKELEMDKIAKESSLDDTRKNTKLKQVVCRACNKIDMPPPGFIKQPGTFILTKADSKWQLYYLDTLLKEIVVNLDDCPDVKTVLSSWEEEIDLSTTNFDDFPVEKLQVLSEALGDFKPSSRRLKMDDYKEIAAIIGRNPLLKTTDESRLLPDKSIVRKTLCCALKDIANLPSDFELEAGRFVITKPESNWQLYYIDVLQRPLLIDLKKLPEVSSLLEEFSDCSESLTADMLDTIGDKIGTFRPAARLPDSSLAPLRLCLSNRNANEKVHKIVVESVKEAKDVVDPNKLNISAIATLEGLFKIPRKAPVVTATHEEPQFTQ